MILYALYKWCFVGLFRKPAFFLFLQIKSRGDSLLPNEDALTRGHSSNLGLERALQAAVAERKARRSQIEKRLREAPRKRSPWFGNWWKRNNDNGESLVSMGCCSAR